MPLWRVISLRVETQGLAAILKVARAPAEKPRDGNGLGTEDAGS
jgi:hypothetical protein